jgi:hypothetical protein
MPNYKKTQQLPIYQKAVLIVKLVDSLTASFPDDNELMFHIKAVMNEDAVLLTSKIAGAEAGKLYSIKMQNAAIIRHHASNLYVQVGGLTMFENLTDQKYMNHIRTEIESFRLLFIDWVSSFDTSNYIWDEWELFNPKGAIPPIDFDSFDYDDFNDESNLD